MEPITDAVKNAGCRDGNLMVTMEIKMRPGPQSSGIVCTDEDQPHSGRSKSYVYGCIRILHVQQH